MAGVSELMRRYAIVETIARLVGIIILVALGVHFARFRMTPKDAPVVVPSRRPFALGFTISAANPVLIITWSGSIAAFLAFARMSFGVGARCLFVAGVFIGMLAWFRLFLWMLARWRERITLRAAQWTIRAAGIAMIALALFGLVRVLLDRHA
jgi:threonine/homoserine/homoserine lactone efflux protein